MEYKRDFILDLLDYSKVNPKKIALYYQNKSVSFGELINRIQRISNALEDFRKRRKKQESIRVAILLPNCCEFLEIFLSCALSQNVCVCLDILWSKYQLEQILNNYKIDVLFIDKEYLNTITINNTADVVELDSTNGSDNYHGWLNKYSIDFERDRTSDSPLFIGFTSGTTAVPKAFFQYQNTWTKSFYSSKKELKTNEQEKILISGPLTHGLSLYAAIEGLVCGATIHLEKKFSPEKIIATIKRKKISTLIVVPTMLKRLLNEVCMLKTIQPIFSVTKIISSGAKVDVTLTENLREIFPFTKLYDYYGASELGFVAVRELLYGQAPIGSVGKPFDKVQVCIKNAHNQEVQANEFGTIWVKSPFTLKEGYIFDNDSSGFVIQDIWKTVGDQGFLDNNGYLHILGRVNSMIISGGLNVYPSEVESALLKMKNIEDVIVFSVPCKDLGQKICAAIKLKKHYNTPTKAEIAQHLLTIIEKYKHPKKMFLMENFPTTFSGKVSIKLLKDKILENDYMCEIK